MGIIKLSHRLAFLAPTALIGAGLLGPQLVHAQPAGSNGVVEEIVVTGTRKEGLAPTETLSPVDVLSAESLSQQASFDLTDGLSRIAPSFNTQRFPIADGTAFLRPVTLRNLSPDHTLVLVNGTRRHRSALVNLQLAPLGTVNRGSQAVDFQTLPAGAIQRVEVLRDGASAQYGSDAIAGVVNIILKDNDEGISLYAQGGEYSEGDGTRFTVGGNAGFGLGASGFLSASFEVAGSDTTSRGNPRPDAAAVAEIVGAENTPLNGFGQRWGDPEVDAAKLFVNAGIDLSDAVELYSHLSYSEIDVISDFFYRGPVLPPENMTAARDTLQRDADGDFMPDPAPQSLVDDIEAAGLNPADYLVADDSSDSGFVLRNPIFTMFPGGYNPDFGADVTDIAFVAGARGEVGDAWSWDATVRVAENEVDYVLSETINPSLGALSPTSFKPGTLTQQETSVNIDVVRPWEIGAFASPLNVAVGAEFRNETYKIGAGDEASRIAGPTFTIFGFGSDGFQGFPTDSAGSFSSDSFAGYVDLEADITERFSAGIALRVEDYEEFGSTEDGKISLRFDVNEQFAIRATANTGFRAPSPGQINTLNVTTSADANGNLIPQGTYPVDHPVALALGSVPLDPEESTAFTAGLIFHPFDNTSVTLDYYSIEVDERLGLRNVTIADSDVAALEAEGVANADLLVGAGASFFSNAFDSTVEGVDVAVTTDFATAAGLLSVDLRHNYNTQEISDVDEGTINESRVFDLENQVPEQRSTLTLGFDTGGLFRGYLRANRYGDWKSTGGLFSPGDASDAASYGSEILVDLEASFAVSKGIVLAIGGENIFDTYPDKEADGTLGFLGVEHALTSPFGFNGAFYYARASVAF